MKKLIQLSLLSVCCLGLFGCPYESQVPISEPVIPVDNKLFGKWVCDDEVYNTYTVARASDNEYKITQKNLSNTTKFKGFLSEVRGQMFMNLYSDSLSKYYIYKIRLDATGNKFTLLPVRENLGDHFGSIEGLHAYMEKNGSFQSIYDENEMAEYRRVDAQNSAITIN